MSRSHVDARIRLLGLALAIVAGLPACGPPRRFSPVEPQLVLELEIEARESGLRLIASRLRPGTPTETIIQSRPVLVMALDRDGATVTEVSAPNPRVIHTAGTKNPRRAVRPRGTFLVRLADPALRIDRVRVKVRDGPNSGFDDIFATRTRLMPIVR